MSENLKEHKEMGIMKMDYGEGYRPNMKYILLYQSKLVTGIRFAIKLKPI